MSPIAKTSIAVALVATAQLASSTPISAQPQSVAVTTIYSAVNTNAQGLPSAMPTSAAGAWSPQSQWTPSGPWSPQATQSEWNWQAWSSSQAAASSATAAAAAVQASMNAASSVPYSNPFTIYTTMTNSLGVITGMPAVATSQPSQPAVATACSGCASVLSQQSAWASSVGTLMSSSRPATTVVAVSSTGSSSTTQASASATTAQPSFAQRTGAASQLAVSGRQVTALLFGAIALLL